MGEDRGLISNVFKYVESVAVPGSVGKTGPISFYRSGLGRIMEESRMFHYSGSLTTPPCTEGVTWSVVAWPLVVGLDQYNKVKKIMGFNARYTQNDIGEVNLLDAARQKLDGHLK